MPTSNAELEDLPLPGYKLTSRKLNNHQAKLNTWEYTWESLPKSSSVGFLLRQELICALMRALMAEVV